jgi:hypothetical protein
MMLRVNEMLTIKRFAHFIFVAVLCILSLGAGLAGTSIPADRSFNQHTSPYANAEITVKIIPSIHQTFGYDLLLYGKPWVHQPNIPGLPGNEGFTTRERAQTVAEFVLDKIRKNVMPPTVTIEDLNSMGVLK